MNKEQLSTILRNLRSCLTYPNTSDVSFETKQDFSYAAGLIQGLEEQLSTLDEESASAEIEALKAKADKIFVGSLIRSIVLDDSKYAFQSGGFFHQCKYPLKYGEVTTNDCPKEGVELLLYIGERALIIKDIPFTGRFENDFCGVFKDMNRTLTANYFSSYELNDDPLTTSTKAIQQEQLVKRTKAKLESKLARNLPYYDPRFEGLFKLTNTKTPMEKYREAKSNKERLIREESSRLSFKEKSHGFLVFLSYLLSPLTLFLSLLYTRPFFKKEEERLAEEKVNRTWVEKTISIDDYRAIQQKRQALKETFNTPLVKEEQKPHKVCIGLDESGKEAATFKEVRSIRLLCDKEQARRWTLGFYDNLSQEDYQASLDMSTSFNLTP